MKLFLWGWLVAFSVSTAATAQSRFDQLFPRRPYTGQTASIQGWSFDDRYFAFTWNPYQTRGRDLHLYDTRTGKVERLTSIEKMAKMDRDALLAIDEHKKEDERIEKWQTLSDEEFRKERQKRKEEQEKRREPTPSYPGVSQIVWANKSAEFLMIYRGDLFRWKVGEENPVRLTQTRDGESSPEYLPDDSGYVYRRGNSLYRVTFGSPLIQQIDPELPSGQSLGSYRISPKGDQLLVIASRSTGANRQVDYITYRDRFATARKTDRGVAEDDFRSETYFYLFDIRPDQLTRVDIELKPHEIYKWPGGEEWQDVSISEKPWSPNGETFTFSAWKRDKKDLTIYEADLSSKKVRKVYIGTSSGEHRTPSLTNPFYTADGKNIVALLDKSGWRHLHLIERVYGKEKQVTTGDFEVYPLQMSADGKDVLVRASKEHLSRMNYYRVNLESGNMTRLDDQQGEYDDAVFAHKSDQFATNFRSWSSLNELYLYSGGKGKALTQSHRTEDFWKAIDQKPDLFTYKNRHGDEIHGFMFKPKGWQASDKRPLMIYVYGGPLGTGKSVVDGGFSSTAYLFNMYLTQMYGFVTVCIDPRGQSGYSARFGAANWEAPGAAQNEDLVDGVKYLVENHGVDPKRVGINGWSFGGFQTQYCLYNSPDVFTLGIAGAGPTEWQNYNTWYTGGVIGNSPKGDGDFLDKFSLTRVAGNLKNPLLLLHGVEDTNVLFQDTVAVYRKLLQAGKGPLVELSLDPTGGHGMGGDMDNRDRHLIYLDFILRRWGIPRVE